MQINQYVEQGKSYIAPEPENAEKTAAPTAQIPARIPKPDTQAQSEKVRPNTVPTPTMGTAQKIALLPASHFSAAFVHGQNRSAATSGKETKSAMGVCSSDAARAVHQRTVREVDSGTGQLEPPERQSPPLRPDSDSREIDLIDVAPESVTPEVQQQFQNFQLTVKNVKESMPPDIGQQASNFIKDRINQIAHIDIDPDKTYVNNFDGAQALADGNDGVTGYQHSKKDLKSSTTLTDFVLRGFDEAWQGSRSDLLNLHFGLYNTNSDDKNYGALNEVKILPSDLRKMFGAGELERYLATKQASFWSAHQAQWQSLAKGEFSALARKAVLDGQLGRQGYELAMKGAANNVPLDAAARTSQLAQEATPDASVQVHRFDINGYSSTDILRFTGKSGIQVLYIPGETQAFHEFKNEDELKDWVVTQTQDPVARQELASHFSIYDRSKGNWGAFSATGVDEGLDNIASKRWNRNSIDVGNSVIRTDVFRDMAERTRQRGKDDLLQITDNADKRKMWLNDLTQTDSTPYGRPIARALSAGNFAASVGARGGQVFGKGLATGRQDVREAAGMNVGLALLFVPRDASSAAKPSSPQPATSPTSPLTADSNKQTEFRATEFPPGNTTEAVNEINERMQAITGLNNVRQYHSLSELEKSSVGPNDASRLKRLRNSLDEVYMRLNSANDRLHDAAEKGAVLQSLEKSLGTANERTLSQAYERLQRLSSEALSRFKAMRDGDYGKITFFERKDKNVPLADESINSPISAFSNMKDRNRIMVNLEGPDEGWNKLAQSESSRRYNVELVDSLMNQLTRISDNTLDYVEVRKDETKDGFALGSAESALAQFTSDLPNDAMCGRVLEKEPDYPDDASVRKILGMTGEHPVNDYMRENARHNYNGMSESARKTMGPIGRTYSDQQRRNVAEKIRNDDMLRADLMTSNADTAALYLRDIGAKRAYDEPPSLDHFLDEVRRKAPSHLNEDAIRTLAKKLLAMDAQSAPREFRYYEGDKRTAGYSVEDADGKLHVFPTESEAKAFQYGTVFWQRVGDKLQNPLGTMLETLGLVSGLSPEHSRRLFEAGNNPLGKFAAIVGKDAGASQDTQENLKRMGEYAEGAIPVWGQARFYSGLVGKAMKGEAPTANEYHGIAMDAKDIASGVSSRNVVSKDNSGVETSTRSSSGAADGTSRTNAGSAGARQTLRQRLKTIQTVGLGGRGAPAAATKWGAEDGLKRPSGIRAKQFRTNRGGTALASTALNYKRFDQNGYAFFKKDNPTGVCQGLSLEAFQRIDRGGASNTDLLSTVSALKKGLNESGPAREALVGSIQSKQGNRKLAGFVNFDPQPTKLYRGDRQMSINELETDIRNLAPNDVAELRMKITGKHGETLDQGHMLLVQRLDGQAYQLFDANNGAFSYRTEDSLRNALEPYMDAAYSDQGVMRPDSFTRYRYRPAAAGTQGIRLTTENFRNELPGLTPAGQQNAMRYLSEVTPNQPLVVRNQRDIDNATQFFNAGAKLKLSGGGGGGAEGAGGSGGPPDPKRPRPTTHANQDPTPGTSAGTSQGSASRSGQPGGAGQPSATGTPGNRVSPEKRAEIADFLRRHPDMSDAVIARRYGVSRKVVSTVRDHLGLRRASGAGVVLAADRRAAIADYMRQHPHETDAEIARRFDVAGSTIGKIRREFGLQSYRRSAHLTPERRAAIANYIRDHPAALDGQIAAEFHVSKRTVNLMRHQLGLQRRSGSGVYLSAERKAQMREYIRQHPEMQSADIARHFQVSTSTIKRLRYNPEAEPPSQPAPAPSPAPGPSWEPVAGPSTAPGAWKPVAGPSTAPDRWSPEAPQSTHYGQQGRPEERPGSAPPTVFDDEQVIQWMFGHLPSREVDRIIDLPDDQFAAEIMRIRQRMKDELSPS